MDTLSNAEIVFELIGHPVTYFAKRRGRLYGSTVKRPQQLAAAMHQLADADFYINLNPAKPKGLRARSADVFEWRHVLIDLDPQAAALAISDDQQEGADVLEQVVSAEWPLCRFSTTIFSGRGLQLWLAVPPLGLADMGAKQRHEIERGMAGWFRQLRVPEGWRVDYACSDLGRLARMPGTVNSKTGRHAAILQRASTVAPTELVQALLDSGAANANSGMAVHRLPPKVELSTWQLLPHLTETAQEHFLYGSDVGSRHHGTVALLRSLQDVGAAVDAARRMGHRANQRCSAPLPAGEVERIVRRVFSVH